MKAVRVGLIGCGFAAELHMHAYCRAHGVVPEVRAVASRSESAARFARRFNIPRIVDDWRTLVVDPEIDVIDICTPPTLHAEMAVQCMQAGKHVICEKPLTGYFGRPGDATPIGQTVPKALMYERVLEDLDALTTAARTSGCLFLYAENWIYAPAVSKVAEILCATHDKILFMKAEESHSGSHAAHAAQWALTGGGALIRQGCHPLSTVLHLKQVEANARHERITVTDVLCDLGTLTCNRRPEELSYIQARPIDVEDWGLLGLTFSDGTKATILSGDMIVGGVRNLVETYTTGGALFANMAPNNHLVTYLTDEAKLGDVYITEKVDRKTGWQFVYVDEERTRGYLGEIQDFVECIAYGREPIAGLALACEVIKIHYAAYRAAEEGRRITL